MKTEGLIAALLRVLAWQSLVIDGLTLKLDWRNQNREEIKVRMLFLSHPIADIDHTKPLQDSCWSLHPFCSFIVNRRFSMFQTLFFLFQLVSLFLDWSLHMRGFVSLSIGWPINLSVHWPIYLLGWSISSLVHQFVGSSVFSVHDFVGISLRQSVSSSVSRPTGLRPSLNACARVNALTRDCIIYQPSFIHDTFFLRSLLCSILTLVFICRIDMDSK